MEAHDGVAEGAKIFKCALSGSAHGCYLIYYSMSFQGSGNNVQNNRKRPNRDQPEYVQPQREGARPTRDAGNKLQKPNINPSFSQSWKQSAVR